MPREPRVENRWRDRHAVASGEEERKHDENRMRDFHIGKKGSETAHEEQTGQLRKTVRSEEDFSNSSSSSSMHVSLEYPASGERQGRPELVFVQNSGHADHDIHISALYVCYEMDERKSHHIKQELDWYRRRRCRRFSKK